MRRPELGAVKQAPVSIGVCRTIFNISIHDGMTMPGIVYVANYDFLRGPKCAQVDEEFDFLSIPIARRGQIELRTVRQWGSINKVRTRVESDLSDFELALPGDCMALGMSERYRSWRGCPIVCSEPVGQFPCRQVMLPHLLVHDSRAGNARGVCLRSIAFLEKLRGGYQVLLVRKS